jgi:flagellar secretion chaperone FliS
MRNPYQNYLEIEVRSADPVKLVRMLYRGAIDAIAAARVHLREGAVRERSRQANKALAIVHELLSSLDRSHEIGQSLARLYAYMTTRLIEANAAQTDDGFAEVERLLATLLVGWNAISTNPGIQVEEKYEPVSCSY